MRDSKRDTDVLNNFLDSVGEGEGGMIWENDIKICMKGNKTIIIRFSAFWKILVILLILCLLFKCMNSFHSLTFIYVRSL